MPLVRPLWTSILLSAIFPGLGHLNQQRHLPALRHMLICGVLLLYVGLSLFVSTHRISEVNMIDVYRHAAPVFVHWLWALYDV